jgi:hypothetical protein
MPKELLNIAFVTIRRLVLPDNLAKPHCSDECFDGFGGCVLIMEAEVFESMVIYPTTIF